MKYIALVAPLALLLSAMVCIAESARTIDAGAKWEVAETTTLSELTIAEGATVTAPEGRSLTMTVDGVETAVKTGTYKGKIVLTPAKDVAITSGPTKPTKYRMAVYVKDGVYMPDESVPSAIVGGSVSNTSAENVKITSVGERFNGIVIGGNSTYTIKNPTINLTGNGRNDFIGIGAGIRVGDKAKVTIDNLKIHNTGAVRTAIWVGDDSEVWINNADIEVHDGVVPQNYGFSWSKGPDSTGQMMMEVPWMLGIVGNNRATLVLGNAKAHYNNSHIKAEGWGAMSTDNVNSGTVYLTKSHVEVVKSGYGAYADGDATIYSSGSTFDVPDYALITTGGHGVFTDGTVVNSHRIGIMAHGAMRGSVTIDKGSIFNTEKAVFQLKASCPKITVDNAKLNSKNGLILEMMANDDPNSKNGPGASGGPGGAPGGASAGGPGGASGGPPSGGAPGGASAGGPGGPGGMGSSYKDLDATFKHVTLKGDFVNSYSAKIGMNLTFEDATITSGISTATAEHAVGRNGEKLEMRDTTELYYLIGEQRETFVATDDANGANVTLKDSKWFVSKTSYLTGLTIGEGSQVVAPGGSKLAMTVDGVATPIAAGTYKGKIVLQVSTGI
jgi:hypothetical protein